MKEKIILLQQKQRVTLLLTLLSLLSPAASKVPLTSPNPLQPHTRHLLYLTQVKMENEALWINKQAALLLLFYLLTI